MHQSVYVPHRTLLPARRAGSSSAARQLLPINSAYTIYIYDSSLARRPLCASRRPFFICPTRYLYFFFFSFLNEIALINYLSPALANKLFACLSPPPYSYPSLEFGTCRGRERKRMRRTRAPRARLIYTHIEAQFSDNFVVITFAYKIAVIRFARGI